MLHTGTSGAEHSFADATESASGAATKAEIGQRMKSDGTMLGGTPVGALPNAWVDCDDWHVIHKPADETITNT